MRRLLVLLVVAARALGRPRRVRRRLVRHRRVGRRPAGRDDGRSDPRDLGRSRPTAPTRSRRRAEDGRRPHVASTWWVGQDPTRTPRIDTAAFPAGRAPTSRSSGCPSRLAFVGANNAFASIENDLESVGLRQPLQEVPRLLRRPAGRDGHLRHRGRRVRTAAVVRDRLARRLPGRPDRCDRGARALARARRAARRRAERVHRREQPGRRVRRPGIRATRTRTCSTRRRLRRPLSQLVLDVNHDDYYAHSGSWDDIQDSAWLHLLAAPLVPLALKIAGAGAVTSVVPGVDCTSSCTTQWDGGTKNVAARPGGARQAVRRLDRRVQREERLRVTLASAVSVTATFGPTRVAVARRQGRQGHPHLHRRSAVRLRRGSRSHAARGAREGMEVRGVDGRLREGSRADVPSEDGLPRARARDLRRR